LPYIPRVLPLPTRKDAKLMANGTTVLEMRNLMAKQSGDPAQLPGGNSDPDDAFLLNLLPHRMRFDVKYRSPEPKISAFLPARNEGDRVIPTIENMWACGADDVTVIDDASEDGSCDPAKLPGDVQIVHHSEASGCGYGRYDGMGCSDGDVCITADAHVQGPEGCFHKMAKVALERRAIVCPATTSAKHPGEWTIYGAALEILQKKGCFEHYCFGDMPSDAPVSPISCLYGSVYVFPKTVVRRMGRVSRACRWGYNEMTHSIRALMCDVPLFVDSRFVFTHRYKRVRLDGDIAIRIANFFRAAFVYFETETYEEVLLPALKARFEPRIHTGISTITNDPAAMLERKEFRAAKVWSDEDFFLYVAQAQLAAQARPRIRVDPEKDGF